MALETPTRGLVLTPKAAKGMAIAVTMRQLKGVERRVW